MLAVELDSQISVVSAVVLTFTVCENSHELPDGSRVYPLLDQVNEWLAEHLDSHLVDCADNSGGSKHTQTVIATGGFNYLNEDEFSEFVLSLDWQFPGNFALLIQPEDGPLKIFTLEGESI